MQGCSHRGCREYRDLSRRRFIKTGAAAAALAGAPVWLPRVAYAQNEVSDRDVIIAVFLRGGADGLTLCVPHGDDNYYAARPTLNIPRPDSNSPFAAIDLDGFFGVPQTFAGLMDAYAAGDLLIVHACGSPDESRSHFQSMTVMETGQGPDPTAFTGWLGRHLASSDPKNPTAVLRAVGINEALQRSLSGSPLALPIPDLADFGLDGWNVTMQERLQTLGASYAQGPSALRATAANTITTIGLLNAIDFVNYQPGGGAAYPDTHFGYSMKSAAALIKADLGVEAIAIDLDGWDTHDGQGSRSGWMAGLMTELGDSLGAFHADLSAATGKGFVVVVMSEFGRVVMENASQGTDHGHGGALLVLGNHIAGGRVLTDWPGLAQGELFQGQDLDTTIDYRDILAEIVHYRLGNSALSTVFPGYAPVYRGVTA